MGTTSTTRRRKTAAIMLAAAAGTMGMGVFATTLSVTSAGGFSAGTQAVETGCDADGVTVTPRTPTWVAETGTYQIHTVDVSGIDDTNCQAMQITVDGLRADNTSIASGSSGALQAGTTTVAIETTIPDANEVTSWAVIIHAPQGDS